MRRALPALQKVPSSHFLGSWMRRPTSSTPATKCGGRMVPNSARSARGRWPNGGKTAASSTPTKSVGSTAKRTASGSPCAIPSFCAACRTNRSAGPSHPEFSPCRRARAEDHCLPACGCSSMVERQLPKLHTRVRFPSPALILSH